MEAAEGAKKKLRSVALSATNDQSDMHHLAKKMGEMMSQEETDKNIDSFNCSMDNVETRALEGLGDSFRGIHSRSTRVQ